MERPKAPNILIVEDENITAMDIRSRLLSLGYAISATVSSGEEAIAKAAELQPDLVLMDIILKGALDGVEAAREIHRQHDIPVIYLTAFSDAATLERAKITEPFGYVLKPFDERDLHTTIEMALYKHGMERKHREIEERYRMFSELASDYVYSGSVKDDVLTLEWVDGAFQRVTSYTLREVQKHGWLSVIHPDDVTSIFEKYRGMLMEKGGVGEYRIITKSGETRWLRDYIRPIWDERHEKVVRFVGGVQDITERRHTEHTVTRLKKAVESSSDVVFMTDTDGVISFVNPEFTRLYGYQPEEVIGKTTPRILKSGELSAEHYDVFWKTLLNRQLVKGELINRTRDGRCVIIESSANAILDEHGNISGFLAIQRDITERKRAEGALKRSEEMLRTIIEAEPECIKLLAPDGTLLQMNAAGLQMVGADSEEAVLGKSMYSLVVKRDRGAFRNFVERVCAGNAGTLEFHIVDLKGNSHHMETHAVRIQYGEEGRTVFLGVTRDVTEPRRAEEELRESEQRLRLALMAANQGLYDLNVQTGEAKVSPEYATMLGYDPAVFHETNAEWIERLHPDDRESVAETYRAYIQGEIPRYAVEFRQRTSSGDWKWILSLGKIVENDADGKPLRMLGTHTDISKRKRAEEKISMFGHTIRSIGEAVSITDLDNRILFVNEAFLKLYGFDESELIGKSIEVVRSPNVDAAELTVIYSSTKAGGWQGETLNRRKDGTDFPISLSTSFVHDESGKAIALVGVAQDITERKQAEQLQKHLGDQLRQAQKLESLGTLAGGIAHDFNNILGIILGHVSLLEVAQHGELKFPERMNAIAKAANRGAGLVSQLLTFARKTDIRMEPVRVNDAVTEVCKLLAETFPKTITMTTKLEPGLPPIVADANQIHQVLVNLCVNARDAMPVSGDLSFVTRIVSGEAVRSNFQKASASSYVQITVADTGTGMDEETKDHIFEPFYTTKAIGKGTGLGLAVVFGIMESHRGFIDVTSALGHGTSFDLFFPVEHRNSESGTQNEGAKESVEGGSETILLVEDETDMLDMLKSVLEFKGYTVVTATNGIEAVEVYAEHRESIDLVITDLGLPKLGGRGVFDRLHSLNSNVKAIVASGYMDPDVKKYLEESGVKNFLPKPYKLQEILKTVRTVLDDR